MCVPFCILGHQRRIVVVIDSDLHSLAMIVKNIWFVERETLNTSVADIDVTQILLM